MPFSTPGELDFVGVKTHTRQSALKRRGITTDSVLDADRIIIPVNIKDPCHWIVVVIEPANLTISALDSLGVSAVLCDALLHFVLARLVGVWELSTCNVL